MNRKYPDEIVVQAVIDGGTIRKAAQILGCQPVTVSRRMQLEEVKKLYAQAKSDLLKEATAELQKGCVSAVNTLVSICGDTEVSPATRCTAATAILQYAGRFTEITDILGRLEALEAAAGDEL